MKECIAAAISAVLAGVAIQSLHAQNYPARPVRMVAAVAPGGGTDILGRLLAQKLSEQMGQQVYIENRAGAGGTIGYEHVAKSPTDGYTLLIAPASVAINTSLYAKLPYTLRDFAPITLFTSAPNILSVHPSLPVTSVKALIALARSKPDGLTAGTSGPGTSPHLTTELFKNMAGIRLVTVHYKGAGPSTISLLSGETTLAISGLPTVMSYLKTHRLRALGVSTIRRTALAPDLPTIAESGVPGFDASNWISILAPVGTPQPIIERLHQEIVRAVRPPEMRERIAAEGADVIASAPGELASHMKSEAEKWARVVKAAGIRPE